MLSIRGISFTFPGNQVRALSDINLELAPGVIHALIGENGAGKSTIARICTGHLQPDSGQLLLNDKAFSPRSPGYALREGLALVPQHPRLAADLKVWESLMIGQTDGLENSALPGLFWKKTVTPLLQERLDEWHINIPLTAPTRTLDSARIHWVALAEALLGAPRYLFLDEPGAAYAPSEIAQLYTLLRTLADSGMGIVIISHRMHEILQYADRIHILRKGALVACDLQPAQTEKDSLLSLMFGGPEPEKMLAETNIVALERIAVDPHLVIANTMEIRGISHTTGPGRELHDIALTLQGGRVHGFVGLKDQGLELLEDVLCGLLSPHTGHVRFGGRALSRVVRTEIGYIPGRRFQRGIAPSLSILDNAMSRTRRFLFPHGFASASRARHFRATFSGQENRDWKHAITSLSGGTIQRLLIERELSTPAPRLVIAAEPYWGLDRQYQLVLQQKLRALANAGSCVIFLCSELDDAMENSDAIHVLHAGRLVYKQERASTSGAHFDQQRLAEAMVGSWWGGV